MLFSFMTEPQLGGTYQDLLRAARSTEQAGLVSFARADHYYWATAPKTTTDAFTSFGGLAREVGNTRLAILVTPITFRHPAVISKSAATLDEMTGGRFDLGVGTGWMEAEHKAFGIPFPSWKERFARLEEALQYIRASFSGQPFEGTFYRTDAEALPRPRQVRVMVGGAGPERTPALAGKYADEYNHFAIAPSDLAPKIDKVRKAAVSAGRDPDTITISVMGPAVLASTASAFARLMADAASFRNVTVDDLTERWSRAGIPMGTPEQAAPAFAAYEQAGVGKYYLQWLDLTDHRGIDELMATMSSIV
ncbi:MAG TPA: LLM class flavin-dependent oxidoreductase [Acidimicrobiia bacterium]|nr:LLM class flavin-dependent oxidoreductase [Acidimicrobiia bacterium]